MVGEHDVGILRAGDPREADEIIRSMNASVSAGMIAASISTCASEKPAGASVVHNDAIPSPSPNSTLSPTRSTNAT
jgi:hypothetical protein